MARLAVDSRLLLRDMGQSATFNGTTSKIDVPHSTQLNITGSVTIGCWVKINRITGSGFNVFMCKGSNEPYELDYDQALNRFRFIIQTNNGFSTRQGTTDTAILNRWAHLVGVYDNSGTPSNAFYVNGQSVSSGTLTGTSLVTNSTALGIGYRSGSNDRFTPCRIDEPFVYAGAMTTAQIQDIYYRGVYPSGLAFMSLLDGNANDASGNGNNGTATSVTYTSDVPIAQRTIPTKPRQPVGELAYNGDFEYIPSFTAASSTSLRWIDGTAAGSTTDRKYGWYLFDISPSANAQFDTTEVFSGNGSLKLSLLDTSGRFIQIFNEPTPFRAISVRPLTAYTLRYYMKTNRTSGSATGAYAAISERSGTGTNVLDTIGTAVNTTTGWTQYTVQVTTDATTRYIMIKLVALGTGGAGNLMMDTWFDNISLMPTGGSSLRTIL